MKAANIYSHSSCSPLPTPCSNIFYFFILHFILHRLRYIHSTPPLKFLKSIVCVSDFSQSFLSNLIKSNRLSPGFLTLCQTYTPRYRFLHSYCFALVEKKPTTNQVRFNKNKEAIIGGGLDKPWTNCDRFQFSLGNVCFCLLFYSWNIRYGNGIEVNFVTNSELIWFLLQYQYQIHHGRHPRNNRSISYSSTLFNQL